MIHKPIALQHSHVAISFRCRSHGVWPHVHQEGLAAGRGAARLHRSPSERTDSSYCACVRHLEAVSRSGDSNKSSQCRYEKQHLQCDPAGHYHSSSCIYGPGMAKRCPPAHTKHLEYHCLLALHSCAALRSSARPSATGAAYVVPELWASPEIVLSVPKMVTKCIP